MSKFFRSTFFVAFIFMLILLVFGIVKKISGEKLKNEKLSSLPSFSFITMDETNFNSSVIKTGPVLIIRFHPECDHCQYEISEILKSDIPGLVTKFLLISSAPGDSISKFLNQFHYSDYPTVIPLADTNDSFSSVFGKDIVPSNYIYNKELKLVKIIFGEVKIETIRKYLSGSE
jgi:hypothetical protein